RGAGDPARAPDADRHGVRVRDDADQPAARPRDRDGLPNGRRPVLARLQLADPAGGEVRRGRRAAAVRARGPDRADPRQGETPRPRRPLRRLRQVGPEGRAFAAL
ncbi:hypothetical protein HK102_008845, partial [Quaeritorhiza haematococci]